MKFEFNLWYLIVSIPDLCNLTYFNRPTPARADKPCEKGKQSRLRYKFFQLQSQYTLLTWG